MLFFLLWMKKWVKNSTFITIETIFEAAYLFQPEILLNMVFLARTKKFFLSLTLVKLSIYIKNIVKNDFSVEYSWGDRSKDQ